MNCSFCESPIHEEDYAISGKLNDAIICEKCITQAQNLLDKIKVEKYNKSFKLLKPSEIKSYLDEYVIDQEEAKKLLSVAIYNHYKRFTYTGEIELEKSNILLTGPTGSGKTYLLRCIEKLLDVPLVIGDATTLTEAGYVGKDVESLLVALLQKTNFDVTRAERGIIFLDEIDKLTRKNTANATRDVGGEGVQQSLLKMIEGTLVEISKPGNKLNAQQTVTIDTSKILFICGGSFEGIEPIVKKRLNQSHNIGFTASPRTISTTLQIHEEKPLAITVDDLKEFGIIPEFLGRLPVIINLHKLSKETLVRVLIEPKNSLYKQYQALLKLDNIELEIEQEAFKVIAEQAYARNTGARSLRSIMENILSSYMYEVPDLKAKKLIISQEAGVFQGHYIYPEKLPKRKMPLHPLAKSKKNKKN